MVHRPIDPSSLEYIQDEDAELAKPRSNRGRLPSGAPNPIDEYVGGRLRQRRMMLGLSQEKLGTSIGLTFQQVQKYERGANRMGASRLYDMARVLGVPVSFFYDEMPESVKLRSPLHVTKAGPDHRGMIDGEEVSYVIDPLTRRESVDLVRAYYRIADPQIRKCVFDLAKSLANTTGHADPG